MTDLLTSEILKLRAATLDDKRKVYNWLACSNLTSEMLGPPNFPENPVPTWDEFNNDYLDHYFDNSQPLNGRCFIIEYNGQEIGQINYNAIDVGAGSTEMDIWLSDRQFTGQGLGIEAIRVLCNYLDKAFKCRKFYIAPSGQNTNAIKAYNKAGFFETEVSPPWFVPDYKDTVLLVKTS